MQRRAGGKVGKDKDSDEEPEIKDEQTVDMIR